MNDAQTAILRSELQSDPLAIGYIGLPHDQIADLINKPQRTVNRDTFSGGLLASCIDPVEHAALTAPQKAWLSMLTAAGELTLFASLKSDIQSVLATATKSLAKFKNNITRSASRGEELGIGRVSASEVADALRN